MGSKVNRAVITLGVLCIFAGAAWAASGKVASWLEAATTTASNPCRSGKACLYAKTSDGKWHSVSTAGTDTEVGAAGSFSGLFGAQDEATALGDTSTTSATFADIGDGATTGFASWTVNIPVERKYLLRTSLVLYWPSGTSQAEFQVMMDGVAVSGQLSNSVPISIANQNVFYTFDVLVTPTAGNHTFKVQWRVATADGTQLQVGGSNSYKRVFTIYG